MLRMCKIGRRNLQLYFLKKIFIRKAERWRKEKRDRMVSSMWSSFLKWPPQAGMRQGEAWSEEPVISSWSPTQMSRPKRKNLCHHFLLSWVYQPQTGSQWEQQKLNVGCLHHKWQLNPECHNAGPTFVCKLAFFLQALCWIHKATSSKTLSRGSASSPLC